MRMDRIGCATVSTGPTENLTFKRTSPTCAFSFVVK